VAAGPLIACVDVDYRAAGAVAAGVWLRGWPADAPKAEAVAWCPAAADYEPGAFYRRELPCLVAVLARGPATDIVVVDGYAWLGVGRPGLGAHLHVHLNGPAVVGVAKTRFAGAAAAGVAVPVLRGSSRSPLYVSAAGVDRAAAAGWVAAMAGPHRLPAMLGRDDRLARTAPVKP